MSLFQLKIELLQDNFQKVFEFFLAALAEENYVLDFISAEFFSMIIEDANSVIYKESNYSLHFQIFLQK